MSENVLASSLFRLDGLVAVVSGGGSGIGLMMAKTLAANGASRVYIIGRRLDRLQVAAQESASGNIIPLQGDVTDKGSLERMVALVKDEVGYINLLVCNSGTTGPLMEGLAEQPSLAEIREHMWAWDQAKFNAAFELNVTGAFFTMVAFLDLLERGNQVKARDGISSSVLITASIASFMRRLATGVAYTTSKAGALHLAKVMATYLGPYGIRVNSLCPGIFPSEMTQDHIGRTGGFSVETIPVGRLGSTEDIAGVVLLLASRAGAYLNGMMVLVDGGRLSMVPATY